MTYSNFHKPRVWTLQSTWKGWTFVHRFMGTASEMLDKIDRLCDFDHDVTLMGYERIDRECQYRAFAKPNPAK